MQIFILVISALSTTLPGMVHAASVQAPTNFSGLVKLIIAIIENLVILIFALTFIAFMWGIVKNWVMKGGGEEGVDNGKKILSAGIIGFVLMVSIWGILSLIQKSIFGQ
jgi:hypothetical protein